MEEYKYIHLPTIVDEKGEKQVNILIKDNRISKISESEISDLPFNCQVIEAKGLILIPGIIDTHVHFRDPGLEYKATMLSESRAALKGGVTTIFDMPNTIPPTTSLKTLEEKISIAKNEMKCNYMFYLGVTNNNVDEILEIDNEKVCGYKIFFGSSTGNLLVDRLSSIEKLFKNSENKIITAHCEDEKTIIENTKKYKSLYPNNDAPSSIHPLIRTDEACFLSTKYATSLAGENTQLNIAHISTKKEISLLKSGKIQSKNITAEVSPIHLWFSDEDFLLLGNKIKCNPSIKTKEDRDALRKALREDKIDIIATDHAPHLLEEKTKPYFDSPSGIPSIEFSLLMILELVFQGELSLYQLQEKMCHNPSIRFSIKDRGFIKEGYFADMVLIDTNQTYKVEKKNIVSKCGWSPLEGVTFHSKIVKIFFEGQCFDADSF
ncbi:MAG: dihydroorotase [Bacteroidales bacterium]|jgi:dihydroorotase|nr:dihydroorotase [Bacteroidales bacterium]